MKKIALFNSAFLTPSKRGGYATILLYSGKERVIRGSENNTTKNRMELRSVIEALRVIKEPCSVEITTDALYLFKGINEWLELWEKRDFKKVKNEALWREYLHLSESHTVSVTWLEAYALKSENTRCQQIAQEEAQQQ